MRLALIPLFPLIGFLINGLWYAAAQGPRGKKNATVVPTGVIASFAIFLSFVVSASLFLKLLGSHDSRVIEDIVFSWIKFGSFDLPFTLRMDELSALFCLVITGVGTLIHVYSIGYMAGDEAPGKYFAYLNLFCVAMLLLVLGGSLIITFLGWEGVGLCSYLLIGFWYTDMEKASAGKKAFIVNRVGDLGFLIGVFLIYSTFKTFDYVGIQQAFTAYTAADANWLTANLGVITLLCLCLFVGCAGKSAQFPLYIWLPDAMAGPTPVSALIHAATMVTSGIYLIARLNFLFVVSPTAMLVIAVVGAFTAFFAATMAFAQNDIKKVLAYSTVSQLGYMFLACGVGAFGAGVFHVITHAFFKALLFMGAGAVIYALHHEQDMMKMGGLKDRMPKTFWSVTIAWAAICGFFLTSGFFSKDEILFYAFASPHGHWALWLAGAATAVMTALYMTRMWALTFLGKPRFHEDAKHKVQECPNVMTYPLMILAVLSALGGFIGIPGSSNWLAHWLQPVVPHLVVDNHALELGLMAVSTVLALGAMYFGWSYYQDLSRPEALKKRFASLYTVLNNKWYVDEIAEFLIVKPVNKLSYLLWKYFDVRVIDWIVVGTGRASLWVGQTVRYIQTGSIQMYAVMILTGIFASLGWIFYGLVE